MNRHSRFIFLLLLLFGLSIRTVWAQTDFASEEEFKKQASKLYEDDEFEKAYPMYSQLVSLYRKDPTYNYRLGVCMLFASDEKDRAITFLEFASKQHDIDREVFFYLAKAYHLNYRFDDAIAQYEVFKKVVSAAKAERFQVNRQIEMCNNAKKLLGNLTDLSVIDKKEVNRGDFFRSYDISGIGGKLLVKPDEKEFRTNLDKKKKEKSIIYLASNNNQIYFSSYGDNEEHGKDIYFVKKLPNGEWSKPESLGNKINTQYDEDYPFLHPNGKVLYFCSKGHNSMGGYDIFKSTLNEADNTWNEPVNLDFPINTPDDDVLYIANANEKEAYFSSARSSIAGKISVYHINVERKPIDVTVIDGAVVKNRDNQSLQSKITIKNLSDNTILGIYNSKAENGAYDVKLPNGGRFLFTVETPGFDTQSEIVVLPVQNEFRPVKQEISYELVTDKLLVKNEIAEANSDKNYLFALNFIRQKSKMDVVALDLAAANDAKTAADSAALAASLAKTTPKTNTQLSNDDIVKIAYRDARTADTEAVNMREQADIALNFANQKNDRAQAKSQEAAALTSAAAKTDDNVKRQALTDEANASNIEAEQFNQETVAAFNLAKKLDAAAIAKREEADLSQEYAKGMEAAVKSKNPSEAMVKLDEQEKKLDALNQANSNSNSNSVFNNYKKEEDNKKHELDKALQNSKDLKQEMTDNETIIGNLQKDASEAKSSQLKKGLNDQIAGLRQDNVDKQKELAQNEIKTAQLQKEYSSIKNQTELVSKVIDKSKTGTSETAAASVASIDKNKLEKQVNEIKNTTASNNTASASNNTAPNNTSANPAKTDTAAIAANTAASKNTDAVKVNNTTADKTANEKQYAYNSAAVNDQITKAGTFNKEGDDLIAQADDFKARAAKQTKASEKKAMAARSKDLEKQGHEKKLKAAKLTADVNKTEYASNKNQVDQLAKASEGNPAGEILKAEIINNEAENNFAKAEKLRKQADAAASFDEKEKAQKEAYASEIAAFEKQKEAIDIYNKYTPAAIAANKTSANNTAGTNTTAANSIAASANANDTASANTVAAQKQFAYTDAAAPEKISKASAADKQGDDLSTQASALKSKAAAQTNKADKAATLAQSKNLLKQSQEKKLEAAQLTADVNKNEYSTSQNKLDKFAAQINDNTSTDISLAEMSNDEAKIYFDKAQQLRKKAETSDIYDDKIGVLNDASKNEMIALEKQKKAENLYENYKPGTEALAINKTVVNNPNKTVAANTAAANKLPVTENKTTAAEPSASGGTTDEIYSADLASTEKISNEADREKAKAYLYGKWSEALNSDVVKEEENYSAEKNKDKKALLAKKIKDDQNAAKEKQALADKSLANAEKLQSHNAVAVTAKTPDTAATNVNTTTAAKQYNYAGTAANDQISKAVSLDDEADALLAQAVALSMEPDGKNAKKNAAEKQKLVKQAQEKKLKATQLFASANKTEYTANQNQIAASAKANASSKAPEMLKAEIIGDEAEKYFEIAKKKRLEAAGAANDALKETALNDAYTSEMTALDKQREAMDIYKNYSSTAVTASANTAKNADNVGNTLPSDNTHTASNVVPVDNTAAKNTVAANSSSVNDSLKNSKNVIPANTNTASAAKSTDTVKTLSTAATEENHYVYSGNPAAAEQITKAELNKKQAAQIMEQSVDLKSEAVKQTNEDAKNSMYSQSEALMSDAKERQLKASSLYASANKSEFTSNQNQLDQLTGASKTNNAPELLKAEIIADEAKADFDKAKKQRAKAETALSFQSKVNSSDDAYKNEMTALKKQKEAIDIYKKYNPGLTALAVNPADNTHDMAVNNTTPLVKDNTADAVPNNKAALTNNPEDASNTSASAPIVLAPNEKFEQKRKTVYTKRHPIPIDEKFPEGLIFKVQVGAFRKPIPQNLFSGMTPLTGETTPQGYIRYTAGIFKKFITADKVKGKIKDLGYKDAFVVAFLDGKRIPINEAYAMASQTPATVLQKNTTAEIQPTVEVKPEIEVLKIESVSTVGGLFYTVQIGVFSQQVAASKLYAVKPVYTEPAPNGNLRYNTGVYNNVPRALEAKEMLNDVGMKDAFVTAYYNGKRITMAEAKQYELQGIAAFSNTSTVNQLPIFTASKQKTVTAPHPINHNTNEPIDTASRKKLNTLAAHNNAVVIDSGIVFKLQIGAFKEEVPLEIANKFLKIAGKGIKYYKDDNGLTIYTVGSFKTYEEASQSKAEVAAADLTDTFITAYRSGKKIPVDEAKALLKK